MSIVFDAIVLAGGEGRRFEGAHKPDVEVDGRRMLDHVLDAVAGARRIALVAPPEVRPGREDPRILQTMEDPPRGGPAAGVAAGLAALDGLGGVGGVGVARPGEPGDGGGVPGRGGGVPVVVLSCDVPRVGPAVPRLLEALEALDAPDSAAAGDLADGPAPSSTADSPARGQSTQADGVALATWEAPRTERSDTRAEPAPSSAPAGQADPAPSSRPARPQSLGSAARPNIQRLAAVYRRESLTRAVEARDGLGGGLHGVSMRRFLEGLDLRPVVAHGDEAQDVDSWADLARLTAEGAG